jgi:GWxTD domain-containing protein
MKWTLPSLLTPWVLIAIAAAATAHAVAPSAPAGLGDLIANPAFEDAYERSFETILSDSQLQDYASLPDSEKLVYRRRFWTANDPTPTTDENEFLSEHIRRLQFAVTELCPHEPFVWDDRGDIALRFGVPSSRQRIIGDVITATGLLGIEPNSEIWTYPGAGMSVRFIDWNLSGTYVLGPEVGGLSARPIMHYLPQSYRWWSDFRKTMGPSLVPRDIETEHVVYRVGALVNRGIEVEREVPVAYGYTPPAEPIPVYYEIVTARGDSGATDVAVNYQIPLDCLSFRSDGFMEEARLTKAVRVLTADFDVVTSDARTVTVTREHGEKTADDEMITDEWRLDSVPGEYIVAISVEDTLTGRAGTGVSRITVPDYDHPGFRMSDIQIATSVGEGRRFLRMGGSVVPKPIRAFRRSGDLIVYFELYGLSDDGGGRSLFTVQTEISGRGYHGERGALQRFFDRWFPEDRHAVSSEVAEYGDTPDAAYWFAIDLRNLAEDNYDLTITVRDHGAGREITRRESFTVLDSAPRERRASR